MRIKLTFCFKARYKSLQLILDVAQVPLSRNAREANPEPAHFGHFGHFGGFGGIGGFGGFGRPFGFGGGSSAHAGAISSPFGSASFASAKAGITTRDEHRDYVNNIRNQSENV
ncbi:hypothetical protein WN51_00621 [Melipona quadrifasciata]|uniref:Uncharacterized protein n=1 Tax=Melipona quadrifasciata TaxID=166423 RepID=A0A0M8ZZT8_9HYME|nr:hypothetical protein WN51_00621 [Melipona quadrifasciata]